MENGSSTLRQIERQPHFSSSPEAMVVAIVCGIGGYLVAEFALRGRPHPTHWFLAVVMGALGYLAAELVVRWREPF